MKTNKRYKVVSVSIVISIIMGMTIGLFFQNAVSRNALEAKAFSEANSSSMITEYSTVENCMFPMKGEVTIWQTAYETGTDSNGDPASHTGSCAMDISSVNGFFCAPFTGKITGYAPDKCNEIVFTSDNKVRVPTGELCKVSVYALHSSNTDIENKMNVSYSQGAELIHQGRAIRKGESYEGYGIHFDIQVVKRATNIFAENAAFNGEELHYKCFFINENVTLKSTNARAFVSEDDDPYRGMWAECNAFSSIKSTTSTLKVSIPYSLAFEKTEEYNFFERAFGKNIDDYIEKSKKISYIAKNYASIDYDSLNEWEKKVYDAAEYEFCDFVPTVSNPETIMILFNAGEQAICSENERTILKGTCSLNEFPTPTKEGYEFKGWFDKEYKKEYTYNSSIDEDIELYAKWEPILSIVTTINENHGSGNGRHDIQPSSVESEKTKEINVQQPDYSSANSIIANNTTVAQSYTITSSTVTANTMSDINDSHNEVIKSPEIDYSILGRNTTWRFEDGVFTVSGRGKMPDYTMNPSDAPWVSIGPKVKKVVIEEGITKVGDQAFTYFNNLEEVILPNSIKEIGKYAFQNTSIQSITLPYGLERIDQGAFRSCKKLISIVIPNSVYDMGTFAFCECESLTSITLSSNESNIGDGTFQRCTSLRTITLPEGVYKIGAYAFAECSFDSMNVTKTVNEIGYGGFYNASIKHIYFGGTEAQWNNINVNEHRNDALRKADISYDVS